MLSIGIDSLHIEPNRNIRLARQIETAIQLFLDNIDELWPIDSNRDRCRKAVEEQLVIVREYIRKPYGENIWTALGGVHDELTWVWHVKHPW